MDAAGAGPVADVRSGDVGTRSFQVPDTTQRHVEKVKAVLHDMTEVSRWAACGVVSSLHHLTTLFSIVG